MCPPPLLNVFPSDASNLDEFEALRPSRNTPRLPDRTQAKVGLGHFPWSLTLVVRPKDPSKLTTSRSL
jgi:hypothetical protein